MENINIGKAAELIVTWAMRLCIGLLTFWSLDILDKINTSAATMVQMGAKQEILQHDLQGIEKRVERIEMAVERLNDKTK